MSRIIALLLAAVMVCGCTFTGSLPWASKRRPQAVRPAVKRRADLGPCPPRSHAAPDTSTHAPADARPDRAWRHPDPDRRQAGHDPDRAGRRPAGRGPWQHRLRLRPLPATAQVGDGQHRLRAVQHLRRVRDAGRRSARTRTAKQIEQVLHFTPAHRPPGRGLQRAGRSSSRHARTSASRCPSPTGCSAPSCSRSGRHTCGRSPATSRRPWRPWTSRATRRPPGSSSTSGSPTRPRSASRT